MAPTIEQLETQRRKRNMRGWDDYRETQKVVNVSRTEVSLPFEIGRRFL